jgi:hypothetical protein
MIRIDTIIVIDLSKGIGAWNINWDKIEVFKMPENVRALNLLFSELNKIEGNAFVIIKNDQKISCEQIKTVLFAIGLPFIEYRKEGSRWFSERVSESVLSKIMQP